VEANLLQAWFTSSGEKISLNIFMHIISTVKPIISLMSPTGVWIIRELLY